MSIEPGKAPVIAVIAFGWLLGAAVLAWLSSPATLQLSRGDESLVTATIESRLFGLFTTASARIERIRSASLVRSRQPGSNSATPARLVFETTSGPVDLGRNQQLFAPDYSDVAAFFKDEDARTLTVSSIARGSERRRFFVAQAVFLFLAFVGLGLGRAAVRSVVT